MNTLTAIEKQIAKLTKEAERLRKAQTGSVIQQIRQLIAEHGLTVDDLFGNAARKRVVVGRSKAIGSNGTSKRTSHSRKATTKNAAASSRRSIGAALYRDPESGAEWTGRGRTPKWIAGHEDRTPFLIAQDMATATKKRGTKRAVESA